MTDNSSPLPLVSFIIPHKGREAMLLDTLSSIIEQDYPADKIEVVLVSQNDAASQQLTTLQERLNLRVIFNHEQQTIAYLRNLGAQQASGAYFAFLDADIGLSANWICTMLTTLTQHPDIVLASAMQINSRNAPPLERIRTGLSNAELDQAVNFLPGRNLFMHRDTFHQVGGFPAHLVTCEDYYFTDKVASLGQLFYTSSANYVHIGEDKAYLPMFKKEIWRGQSNLASLSGRSVPFREIPSFIVPPAVVVCFIIALLSAVYSIATSLFFLITGIAPVAIYAFRLKALVSSEVSLLHCFWFYLVYFPARAIGTVIGMGKTINTGSHK